jgi:hypothetical protein
MVEIGGVVHVDAQRADDHTLVSLVGPLSLSTTPQVGKVLLAHFAAGPPVLVDLSRLEPGWPPAVEVFHAALQAGGGWPLARLVLFAAEPAMVAALQALDVVERVPLANDYPAARARCADPPDVVDRYVNLVDDPTSARLARDAARAACHDWRIPHVAADLALIASELVINAVEHAYSAPRMTVSLEQSAVTVSVRDDLPGAAPRPQLACVGAPGGQGLLMVTALSTRWGVIPHDDGKTVWARLSTADG